MKLQPFHYLPETWEVKIFPDRIRLIAPKKKQLKPFLDCWLHELKASATQNNWTIEIVGKDGEKYVVKILPTGLRG